MIAKLHDEFDHLIMSYDREPFKQAYHFMIGNKIMLYQRLVCFRNLRDIERAFNIHTISRTPSTVWFYALEIYDRGDPKINTLHTDEEKVDYMLRKALWCDKLDYDCDVLQVANKEAIDKLTKKYYEMVQEKFHERIIIKKTIKKSNVPRGTETSKQDRKKHTD